MYVCIRYVCTAIIGSAVAHDGPLASHSFAFIYYICHLNCRRCGACCCLTTHSRPSHFIFSYRNRNNIANSSNSTSTSTGTSISTKRSSSNNHGRR